MRHSKIVFTLVGIAVALGVTAALAAAPAADAYNGHPSRLDAGHAWTSHVFVESPNGEFQFDPTDLYMSEGEGDLITTSWEQNIDNGHCGRPALEMQRDGNLVLYCRPGGRAIWASHTHGSGHTNHLQMQDDGNLVIYTAAGRAVWASRSGQAFMSTGEALLPGHQLRGSNDYGATFGTLTMRRTGNLTMDWLGHTYWTSNTHTPGSSLHLLRDGNLMIQGPYGRPVWSTHTDGSGALTFLTVSGGDRRADGGPLVWLHHESAGTIIWERP